jgi:hypothetical protein
MDNESRKDYKSNGRSIAPSLKETQTKEGRCNNFHRRG